MSEPVVVTEQLTKRYGHHVAVDAVSLTVQRGEVYGFLGPNGAGKTTTLRILLGLVRPSGGAARVLGGRPGHPSVLRRVGALVEEPGFFPYLSGRDNLRVLARHRGLADSAVGPVLEQVGLAVRGGDPFRSYSLGMRQRLGVAAAMLGDPELLILDEPTNGLDPAGMADMRELVRALADRGQTVLLSSHVLQEVQNTCDRVGVIADGRLLVESGVTELRGSTSLVVRAEPIAQARRVVESTVGSDGVRGAGDGALSVLAGPDHTPEIVRALVGAGVDVYEIAPVERSLEEAFFEVTSRPSGATEASNQEMRA